MVSSPNTDSLYGPAGASTATANAAASANTAMGAGADTGAEAKTAYDAYAAAEKKKADDAAAAAEEAKKAAAGQVGYKDQLDNWVKTANDWTGGQTSFSNPYMIPILQMRARQNAGAIPQPGAGASSGDWALYNTYVQKYSNQGGGSSRGSGNSSMYMSPGNQPGGGHLR